MELIQDLNRVVTFKIADNLSEVQQFMLSKNINITNLVNKLKNSSDSGLREAIMRALKGLSQKDEYRLELTQFARELAEICPTLTKDTVNHLVDLLMNITKESSCVEVLLASGSFLSVIHIVVYCLNSPETEGSQLSQQVFVQLLWTASALSDGLLSQHGESIKKLLIDGTNGVSSQNMVTLVRYFELSVHLAHLSEQVYGYTKESLQAVLAKFFDLDALTQMSLIPFFLEFSKLAYTSEVVVPFLNNLFKAFRDGNDVYEMVQSELVVMAASVYARNPKYFNVFANEDYLWFLRKYCTSDPKVACSCLFFLFQQKSCLVDFFAQSAANLELLRQWLGHAENKDFKHDFLQSLSELLASKEDDSPQSGEIVRRLFSNIGSKGNLPNPGKESTSVDYVIAATEVPYENDELLGLTIIYNLIAWDWGAQAFFANTKAVDYLLTRVARAQMIVVKKFDIVKLAIKQSASLGGFDSAIVERLVAYQAGGVYGENEPKGDIPEVAGKAAQ